MGGSERSWHIRWRPTVTMRTRLAAAAGMWTIVGCVLATVGVRWVIISRSRVVVVVSALVAAGVAGVLKSRFILRKTASRTTARIVEQGDDRCLGGFLSWKSWLVVAAMATFGRVLRGSGMPLLWLGVIYEAVGIGLAFTSIDLWRTHHKL
ncbi:MAG: hypothetical protein H6817_09350 [Phycisphaerales bacterium]|nr:hypothetical protein [Phycisphaerales bacterium]